MTDTVSQGLTFPPASTTRTAAEEPERCTDRALMQRYAEGDAAAFDELYERHKGPLFRYLKHSVGIDAVAEELFHEAWVRVIDARERYIASARFSTWLYRIARNLVIDRHRRPRPLPLEAPDALPAGNTGAAANDPDERRLGPALRAALSSLPLEQRTTVLLHLEQDMTLQEIADICGCGRETIKSRMRYATAKLREALGDLYESIC
ncbi:MAG: sigma-70 family RNA polymerase sigma factor [Pseudomonadota bacterium]